LPSEGQLPPFLPVSLAEARSRGWSELDVVFISGDAYVDHPAFAPALLGRMLEARGFRVGIIARPRPDFPEDVAALGRPRLFFAVAPGAVDSMVNNYTAQKRRRRTDEYAPGGRGGGRPGRALIVYCNLIRRVFGKTVAILGGGIEASLRRFAHYDFWDDAVRRPILLDVPADALVYGMGERPLIEFAEAMRTRASAMRRPGELLSTLAKTIRGAVWRRPASESPPEGYHRLPSFEAVRGDPREEVRAFNEERRFRARGVYQDCAGHRVAANPPARPLSTAELDAVYGLPFARRAHPSYTERVPALEQVQFSVTSHRGCFGGCAFCGIAGHQGKVIQSRSRESILAEVRAIAAHPDFRGTIRDIGGPTANMWGLGCPKAERCNRTSCLAPEICPRLDTDQSPYLRLLDAAAATPGVRHLFVSTGVRMDLALRCPDLIKALARKYTSGYARVAPEHVVPHVLETMMKPAGQLFERYLRLFREGAAAAGKELYALPYFIAAHPGSRLEDMIEVALLLRRTGLRVEQCQIFTPLPGTASAVMYHTGINPYTGEAVFVERNVRRRQMQKALVLYHRPENRKLVMEALEICGRRDLARTLLPRRKRSRKAAKAAGGNRAANR